MEDLLRGRTDEMKHSSPRDTQQNKRWTDQEHTVNLWCITQTNKHGCDNVS